MSEKYRVLIVEEDEKSRQRFKYELSSNFEVVEARDGFEALDRLGKTEPDLALIDFNMQMMGGSECCRRMKNHRGFENLAVYLMAETLDQQMAQKGYAEGAELCLQKDIDPTRLIKNILISARRIGPPRPKKRTLDELANLTDITPIPKKQPEPKPTPERPRPAMAQDPKAPAKPAAQKPKPRAPEIDDIEGKPDPFHDRPKEDRKARRSREDADQKPSKSLRPSGARKVARTPRLMVVDDDSEALTLIQMAMEPEFEVLSATDGILAMERVFDYEPDLFLIDIMMPKMNGYQLVQSLRQMPNYSKSPMVFLTAKSSRRDKQYAEKLRIDGYITKPFDVDQLKEQLLQLVRKPDFRIRPKTHTFREVRRIESERARKKAERAEQRINRERYKEIDEFVRKSTAREEAGAQKRSED